MHRKHHCIVNQNLSLLPHREKHTIYKVSPRETFGVVYRAKKPKHILVGCFVVVVLAVGNETLMILII